MFSQLGPLFKTVLRQAESADTRLAIRRDEKQDPERKQDFDQPPEEESSFWEDSTSVSVEALRTFLIEFLKTRGNDDGPATKPQAQTPVTPTAPPPGTNVSPRAAQAMKAYGAMAAQTHEPPPETPYDPAPDESSYEAESGDLADLLAADELRTIHRLIHELDLLARRGITMLTIEKADTFLESLVAAVQLEKTRA